MSTPAGVAFPKGRVEVLVGHVLRRCSNVTQPDRDKVFLYSQQNPSPHADRDRYEATRSVNRTPTLDPFATAAVTSYVPEEHFHSSEMLALVQQQSALDTLAEVSRRHLDYTAPTQAYPFSTEQAFIVEMQRATADAIHHPRMQLTEMYESPLPALPAPASREQHRPTTEAVQSQADLPVSPLDPHLSDRHPADHSGDSQDHGTAEELMSWNPVNQSGQQALQAHSPPPHDPIPGFGLLSKRHKARVRGHFTDSRRKEVQENRKRGACLRCRMLKKPCSEGEPCSTCASVESARLWKGKCLRTRLADEFGLWASSLFHTRASIEVPAAVQGMRQLRMPGRVEVRLFTESEYCMSFAVRRCYRSPDTGTRPNSDPPEGGNEHEIWLLEDGDTIGDRIDAYVDDIASSDHSADRSIFWRTTRGRAQTLMREEADQTQATSPQQGSRSCYNLQSQLVRHSIKLWTGTNVLANSQELELQLRYVPDKVPQIAPQAVHWDQHRSSGSQIPASSYIKSQLLGAVESWCSRLAKGVISELERRLLQRQQASRFATFLSAVLLLSAVERMTGIYWQFDDDGAFAPAGGFASWPLDQPFDKLWRQGEHFADLLIMLLRMRALPPRTAVCAEGTLVVVQDKALPVQVNGKAVKDTRDDLTSLAAAWLDPVDLSVDDLQARRDSACPARDAGPGAWDMRFVSKLLLPDRST
ncbi:hypothetical protein LTR53_014508 [Teratosphaeriaceae sp. CCFEE 6253]|nr:hypothetical protein LTR53_014508 [Teratosphaeriaceae sp. CCFEE 6253]